MTIFHPLKRDAEQAPADAGVVRQAEVSQEFLDRIPGGIFRYPDDGVENLDYVSRGLIEMFGCTDQEDFAAYTGFTFPGLVLPEDLERVQKQIRAQIDQGGSNDEVRFRIRRKDGQIRYIEDRGRRVVDSEGQAWFYVTLIDVTEEKIYRDQLERSNERLEMLAAMSNDIVFDVDRKSREVQVFGDFEKRFGRQPLISDFALLKRANDMPDGEIETMSIGKSMASIDDATLLDFEISLPDGEGKPQWCRYQSLVCFDGQGNPTHRLGRLLDTHETTMRRMMYKKMAERDGLTDVLNRETAIRKIEERLEESDGPCTFIIVDCDDFKHVNDTFGHPSGDAVLKDLAQHLKSSVREDDIVSRFGGDEFVVFLDTMRDDEARERVARRIMTDTIRAFTTEDGQEFEPTVSLGAATWMRDARDKKAFEELYRAADQMLYETKKKGKHGLSMTTI